LLPEVDVTEPHVLGLQATQRIKRILGASAHQGPPTAHPGARHSKMPKEELVASRPLLKSLVELIELPGEGLTLTVLVASHHSFARIWEDRDSYLRRVYRRFQRWRSSHADRSPIPEPLWAAAAEVAREQRVFRAAKALRLEYGKLKQWVEAASPAAKRRVAKAPAAAPRTVRTAGVCGADRLAARQFPRMPGGTGGTARPDADAVQGNGHGGAGGVEPGVVGRRGMPQVTPQTRILVAVEAVDFRNGIDGLARVCQEQLQADPFSGRLFVFRNRRRTALKILAYDGRGFWLCQKRLSRGRFGFWPVSPTGGTKALEAHELYVLLAGGDTTSAQEAPVWRQVGVPG